MSRSTPLKCRVGGITPGRDDERGTIVRKGDRARGL